jgi:RNA polymerase sigma-70 factor (ECF subfamily)
VPRVPGAPNPEAAVMKSLYGEHAPDWWPDVMQLNGDASAAEDVVQETLLRAWQFTLARNMIIDERRSGRFHTVVSSLDGSNTLEQSTLDEVNATLGVTR